MAMMELYSIGKSSSIYSVYTDYFILKLDDINHNSEVASQFRTPIQNISDIFMDNYNEIFLGYSSEKKSFLKENEKGKLIRDTFFKEDSNGSFVYLGSLINLSEDVKEKLEHYFKNALLSPNNLHYEYSQRMLDIDKFSKLSESELLKYKKFIDENIDCYAILLTRNNLKNKEDMVKKLYNSWRENMSRNKLDYRLNAYDKATELLLEEEKV